MSIGPGDVVVCVQTTRDGVCQRGVHYRVKRVLPPIRRLPGLHLFGIPDPDVDIGYRVDRFRKIESDPELASITERIKACRPTKTRQPA